MSSMTVHDFALALARPLVRRAGNDETCLGGVRDRARARELLDKIWDCRTGGEVGTLLGMLGGYGTANELDAYVQAAKAKSWTPNERDLVMVRKAGTASALRKEIGERALLGWDVSRYVVLAGWASAAGLIDAAKGLAMMRKSIEELVGIRKSFADVAREVALGHQWAFGKADEELLRIAGSLEPLPWPSELTGFPAKRAKGADAEDDDDDDEEETRPTLDGPVSLSVSVSVDCPACLSPMHFRSLGSGQSCRCSERVPMSQASWVYLLEGDVGRYAPGKDGDGELTTDFGEQWFSRRSVKKEAPRCPRCDGALSLPALFAAVAAGGPAVVCGGCREPVAVRPADDVLRAIHPEARGIAGEVPDGFTKRPAEVACLGCEKRLHVDGASRILRCDCGTRTWVDDEAWRAIAGPEKRPRWILLFGPAAGS